MDELHDLLEKCVAAATASQPGDLIALAQLHSDLQTLRDLLADRPAVVSVAQEAAELIEKIVLGESQDPSMDLRQIESAVARLQSIIRTEPLNGLREPGEMVAPAPAPAPATAPATELDAERVIADDELPQVEQFVAEATGHLDLAEASLLKLGEDPADMAEINAVFRAFHSIKGVAAFLDLKQIGALAHAAESLLDRARKGKTRLDADWLDAVLEARDVMKHMVSDIDFAAREKRSPAPVPGLTGLLSRLADSATASVDPGRPGISDAGPTNATAPAPDATVKIATPRLDALIDTVGELVIAQAMVAADLGNTPSDNRLARNLSQLGKITRTLQDLSMSMRMVPIAGVFQKMARLARDTARKAGKEVEFIHAGDETELDRNVVESISDPLVHMVRNAIDHGLEMPDQRVQAGKPRQGKLTITASHQAGSVVIEISDDGRGLQREKIVQKAVAAGIVRPGQALSEPEIFQLIFHPGLSTAETVTNLSGRGVGMDVVKKNVDALRGRIEIASTPGQGARFTVRLPLTLAVIDGLIVKVASHRYIVPITSIEQSLRPSAGQLSTVQGRGELCQVRDRLLPIVRLHKLFDIAGAITDPTQALLVVVQEGADRACLLVDELIGQQQVVIKSIGKEIGALAGFAGCAILGDGNVSLILDVGGIVQSALRP